MAFKHNPVTLRHSANCSVGGGGLTRYIGYYLRTNYFVAWLWRAGPCSFSQGGKDIEACFVRTLAASHGVLVLLRERDEALVQQAATDVQPTGTSVQESARLASTVFNG